MTSQQLSDELKRRYEAAGKREVALTIHLFGIEFADALVGHPINTIAESGTGYRSYGTDIRNGMRLAKYVSLKPQTR